MPLAWPQATLAVHESHQFARVLHYGSCTGLHHLHLASYAPLVERPLDQAQHHGHWRPHGYQYQLRRAPVAHPLGRPCSTTAPTDRALPALCF